MQFFVKREMWRVAEMFPGKTSWTILRTCLFVSLILVRVRVVPDVTDVPVSPSSVVTELRDVSPCGSDWEFVAPQSFSFSKKRAHCGTDTLWTFCARKFEKRVWRAHCNSVVKPIPPGKGCDSMERRVVGELRAASC